jgi:hypothetical protein
MQVVTWSDWLERHIPYYQQQQQQDQYGDSPPAAVLIIDPTDRYQRSVRYGYIGSTWEAMDNQITKLDYCTKPIFLDTDTHQRWYWAFWSQNEALAAVIRLS